MADTKIPLIDLSRQHEVLRGDILSAIEDVYQSQTFILGPENTQLEQEIAEICDVGHAVSCGSGTDALVLSLMALGIGAGDEVIVPSYSFFATSGAVSFVGARPVFVDIEPVGMTIDVAQLESVLTDQTKAIIPVHLFGQCANMEEVLRVAHENNLYVIEDAAQAIGATWMGRPAGSFGDTACFSFYPTKNLGGAGDGGMVVTQNAELAEKMRVLTNHGQTGTYVTDQIGMNSRLSTIQAAILLQKVPHLQSWNAKRQEIAQRYDDNLRDLESIETPQLLEGNDHIYHQYVIRTSDRDGLRGWLAEQGIGSGLYYPVPLPLQPVYKSLGYTGDQFPIAAAASKESLALPIFPELTPVEVRRVIETIREFIPAPQ